MRAVLAVVGLAAVAYGGVLAWEFGSASFRDAWQGLAFFVGGPVVHDAVVAPVVGVLGLLLSRLLPPRWRAPVAAGAVLTGVLVLLALPLLWRPFGVPPNPGLHDRNYLLGLGVALGVVWAGVVIAALARRKAVRHGGA